ncbi:unnamed protein product (macronuclear) [Paramecium tetraurelia]|uniref:START domain-containing protein n=1 Tax=Paramecium tetraurelia TaxID=5888 RepID=A0DH01_PARTE|nr:uncharacterized protein GSPATT00002447001 [Paramecium tetraurelia]CAK82318.1 unnamed protein product [Paramecium tetraurelia]|eukprot:XP_001449715.1 hypothetical protein (macronuclear) [Paramecium tetraurelia strain d4-2]
MDINEKNLWELLVNKNGYTVHVMKNPENGAKINRTQAFINKQPEFIAQYVSDLEKRKQTDARIEYASVLEEIDKDSKLLYIRMKPPIPFMSSRDLVLKWNDNCMLSVIHQKQPPIHNVERAEMYLFGWILTPQQNGSTKVVLIQCFDMKGQMPQQLGNQFTQQQTDLMLAVIQNLSI